MKRLRYILFGIGVVVFVLGGAGAVHAQSAETITHYHTALHLTANGALQVTETIDYNFGSNARHGIYRDIPTTLPDTAPHWWQERYATINGVQVTMDGRATPFTTGQSGGVFHIKIGDPNAVITGSHQFVIAYVVKGAVVKFTDGTTGLYWNAVSPAGWQANIAQATATLTATPGLLGTDAVCYTGAPGATTPCPEVHQTATGFSFTAATGSGLTIQAHTVPGAVTYTPQSRARVPWGQVIATLLVLVAVVFSQIWINRFKRKNRIPGPIIAQYEPYPDPDTKQPVEPMYAGLILDQSIDQRDVTAAILYLATEGYITLKRTERKVAWKLKTDDHEITLVRPLPPDTEPILKKTMELLQFDGHVGETVSLHALQHDHNQQKTNYQLRMDIIDLGVTYLREHGYTESLHKVLRRTKELVFGVAAMVVVIGILIVMGYYVAGILLATNAVIFLLITASDRLTPRGYEARNYLKGFKLFLSVTDKDRFAFHDDPAKDPQTFMQYLPYAVAFGVEHKWAAVFSGFSIPQPEWYSSANGTAFNAAVLTQSLDSFSSQFATASRGVSAQSSNFGGGFAGGGGGGGSW